MKKYFFINFLLLLTFLFSCHPDQYLLFYHFPSKEILADSRAYKALMPGLRVFTMKNYKEKLIGMVGAVRYEKDTVAVDIMLDRKIPVGSGVRMFLCSMQNVVFTLAKGHKCYRPGEMVKSGISLDRACQ